MNNLFDTKYNNSTFILTGTGDNTKTLTKQNRGVIERFMVNDNAVDVQVNHKFLQKQGEDDIITKLEIIEPSSFEEQGNSYGLDIAKRTYSKTGTSGGRKASVKKEVCGKLRCIYKIAGSRKEHIKYKGQLIAVADYKKLMKKS